MQRVMISAGILLLLLGFAAPSHGQILHHGRHHGYPMYSQPAAVPLNPGIQFLGHLGLQLLGSSTGTDWQQILANLVGQLQQHQQQQQQQQQQRPADAFKLDKGVKDSVKTNLDQINTGIDELNALTERINASDRKKTFLPGDFKKSGLPKLEKLKIDTSSGGPSGTGSISGPPGGSN